MRIYELAKHLNAKSEILVDLLLIAGFEVKSHMSRLTDGMLVEISEHFKLPPDLTRAAKKAKVTLKAKALEEAKAAKIAKTKAAKEARAKAKAEREAKAKAKAEKEAREEAEKEANAKAEKEAKAKAEREAKIKAEQDAKAKKELEAVKAAEAKKEKKMVAEKKVMAKPRVPAKAEPRGRAESGATARTAGRPGSEPAAARPRTSESKKPPRRGAPGSGYGRGDQEAGPSRRKPQVPRKKETVDVEAQQKAVRESVRRTLAKIETTRKTKRRKSRKRDEGSVVEPSLQVMEGLTVGELADAFKLESSEVVQRCLDMGFTASIDQNLERETIEVLADDFGKHVEFVSDEIESLLKPQTEIDTERLKPRSPVVTVMGHVDHGKTSILDFIRKTNIAAGEVGGITQQIGAYEVELPVGTITFIDTPGHEAFTTMRARGAQVTDIVVLVVSADDGVMPQTIEAIDHAVDAGVPIVVAINKMDLPGARPAQVKQQLADRGVVAEEFGGDVVVVEVSAKTGEGIDKLLDMILLQADVLELKADEGASGIGVAVEVKKEEGRGILCTILVTQGTLRVGDVFVIGQHYGKARALLDYRGRVIREVLPSMPVLVLGCNGLPEAGDKLTVVESEREARDLSMRRQHIRKEKERRTTKKLTLEELYSQIELGSLKELRLIIKADTDGSVGALCENLSALSVEDIGVKVIHSGVGVVNESDILLADSSDAIIIAFGVKVAPKALELSGRENIEIRSYNIIYECITEVDEALRGLLEPIMIERMVGRAEVRQVFKVSRLGLVAGSYVEEGSITRNAQIRVLRGDEVIFEGKISSLKRFRDDVREVAKDFECGIGITGLGDLREGDIIEAYVIEEKARVF